MKVKAFTITEMIVAMILSAIIFGAVLVVFDIMSQQYQYYEQNYQSGIELDQFSHILKRDFDAAERCNLDGKWLLLEDNEQQIYYKFETTHILRETNILETVKDTFHITPKSIIGHLERQQVDFGIIDQVEIRFLFFDQPYELSCFKQYDSKDKITYGNQIE